MVETGIEADEFQVLNDVGKTIGESMAIVWNRVPFGFEIYIWMRQSVVVEGQYEGYRVSLVGIQVGSETYVLEAPALRNYLNYYPSERFGNLNVNNLAFAEVVTHVAIGELSRQLMHLQHDFVGVSPPLLCPLQVLLKYHFSFMN